MRMSRWRYTCASRRPRRGGGRPARAAYVRYYLDHSRPGLECLHPGAAPGAARRRRGRPRRRPRGSLARWPTSPSSPPSPAAWSRCSPASCAGSARRTSSRSAPASSFSGSLETAYRACLWSRLAGRVLLPLTTGRRADGDELYATAQRRRLGRAPRRRTARWPSTSPAPATRSATRASARCASRTRSSTSSAHGTATGGRRWTRARPTCASTRTSRGSA